MLHAHFNAQTSVWCCCSLFVSFSRAATNIELAVSFSLESPPLCQPLFPDPAIATFFSYSPVTSARNGQVFHPSSPPLNTSVKASSGNPYPIEIVIF